MKVSSFQKGVHGLMEWKKTNSCHQETSTNELSKINEGIYYKVVVQRDGKES